MSKSRASNILYPQNRPGGQSCHSRPRSLVTHHEDIAGLRHLPSLTKDLNDIPELPVDIATDSHGTLHKVDVALFQKQISNARAEELHLSFWQVLALSNLPHQLTFCSMLQMTTDMLYPFIWVGRDFDRDRHGSEAEREIWGVVSGVSSRCWGRKAGPVGWNGWRGVSGCFEVSIRCLGVAVVVSEAIRSV